MTRTQKLVQDYLDGQRIVYTVCTTQMECLYTPRSKHDAQPWATGGYRFSSGELTSVSPTRPKRAWTSARVWITPTNESETAS